MSAYPLNNTNYNWERRPKKCKCDGGGGGGDDQPFDVKAFGDEFYQQYFQVLEAPQEAQDQVALPDYYYLISWDNELQQLVPQKQVESSAEFAAYMADEGDHEVFMAVLYESEEPERSFVVSTDGKDIYGKEHTSVSQITIDGKTYYTFARGLN